MRWASLAALSFLLASGDATAEPFSLSSPAEGQWGHLVIAIVDHARARPTGGCYLLEEGFCAPAFQGAAEIIHYLSPRPDGWRHPGRFPQIRFANGRPVRWVDPGVRLAILAQTEKDHLRMVWSTSAEGDRVCLSQHIIEQFHILTSLHHRPGSDENRQLERCFRLQDMD